MLNVPTGEMSIVGPRPAIDYELEHYAPARYARFEVRPGLTGLWQTGATAWASRRCCATTASTSGRGACGRTSPSCSGTPLAVLRSSRSVTARGSCAAATRKQTSMKKADPEARPLPALM